MSNYPYYVISPTNVGSDTAAFNLVSIDKLKPNILLINNEQPKTVSNYGLINDGITDCTKPLQAVIDNLPSGSNSIYFPAGTYILSNTINISKNNLKIYGDNATLKFASFTTTTSKMFMVSGSNIEISDLILEGNQFGYVNPRMTYGIYFQNCNTIRVNNVICNNFSVMGLTINTSKNIVINNSRFDKNGGMGMEMMIGESIKFNNCTFSENGYNGAKYEDFGHGFVPVEHRSGFGLTMRFISKDIQFYNCVSNNNGRDGFDVNQGSHDVEFFSCICNGNNDGGFTLAADTTYPSIPGDGKPPYNISYYNCIAENNIGAGLAAYCPVNNINIIGGKYYNNRRSCGWVAGEEATSLQPNIYFAAGSNKINIDGPACYDNRQMASVISAVPYTGLLMLTVDKWDSQYDTLYPGVTLLDSASKFIAYGQIQTSSDKVVTLVPTTLHTFDINTIVNKISNGYVTQKKVATGILFDHACQGVVNVNDFGDGFVPSATWDMPVRSLWASYFPNPVGFTDVKLNSGLLLSSNILLNGYFKDGFNNWIFNVPSGNQPVVEIKGGVLDAPHSNVCNMSLSTGSVIELYPNMDTSIGLKDKFITFGGWIKTNSKKVYLQSIWSLSGGSAGLSQVSHPGDNQWHWLELNGLMSSTPFGVRLYLLDNCNIQLTGFVCSVRKL